MDKPPSTPTDIMPTASLKAKRPLIFLGVGLVNTLLDFAFYSILATFVLTAKDQIGLVGVLSGTVALLCAFLTHSLITWRGSHITHRTIVKFLAFTGFGMWVLRPLLLSIFIHLGGLYGWVYDLSRGIHLPLSHNFIASTGAFGFMVVIVLSYNYYVYNRFVFNHPTPNEEKTHQDKD